jgi:hypothetical protein
MQQQRRRSGIILALLALGLLAGAALAANPAQAVDAVGPYYALPAWDRKIAPVNRFVVLTDWNSEAVLDKETGLVWEKSPSTDLSPLLFARFQCEEFRTTSARIGWRLPSMDELASLIDPSVASPGPTLPPGHPFLNVLGGTGAHDYYWSATLSAEDPARAWVVSFGSGGVTTFNRANSYQVWCVRGGNSADAY